MLGMTLALRLSQRGHEVILLEAAPRVGGLASAWRIGNTIWDRFYHVILYTDTYLRRFLEELGLEKDIQWKTTKTGFYVDGQFHSLSNVWEFLRFPPLGLKDKLRLGMTIWKASRMTDGEVLDRVPVSDWLQQQSGGKTYDKIWRPLLQAKLGSLYPEVSAAFIWSIIQRMYAARRTGMKREMFGFVPGGYARICDALVDYLDDWDISLYLGARVESIRKQGKAFRIDCSDGTSVACDHVIVTTPCPLAAQMCPDLTSDEREHLGSVRYLGVVCASFLLRTRLPDCYITNIADSRVPYTAVINMSALIGPVSSENLQLVYLPQYVAADDAIFDVSDREIEKRLLEGLRLMFPQFSIEAVAACRIARARYVQAIPVIGYRNRVPSMVTSVPGLYLVNSSQIIDGTLNVNETIHLAESAVKRLTADQFDEARVAEEARC